MKKMISVLLLVAITLVMVCSSALAETKSFSYVGGRGDNAVQMGTKATKSSDGDQYFYVTLVRYSSIDNAWVYFGPRRILNGAPGGALCPGLKMADGGNSAQKMKYTSGAVGGGIYALNMKVDSTGMSGVVDISDARWTP